MENGGNASHANQGVGIDRNEGGFDNLPVIFGEDDPR